MLVYVYTKQFKECLSQSICVNLVCKSVVLVVIMHCSSFGSIAGFKTSAINGEIPYFETKILRYVS